MGLPLTSNVPMYTGSAGTHPAASIIGAIPEPGIQASHIPLALYSPPGPSTAPSGVGSEMNPSTANLDSGSTSDTSSSTTPVNAPAAIAATTSTAPGISISNLWGAGMLLIVAIIFISMFAKE